MKPELGVTESFFFYKFYTFSFLLATAISADEFVDAIEFTSCYIESDVWYALATIICTIFVDGKVWITGRIWKLADEWVRVLLIGEIYGQGWTSLSYWKAVTLIGITSSAMIWYLGKTWVGFGTVFIWTPFPFVFFPSLLQVFSPIRFYLSLTVVNSWP